jgi:hypothetical protein
MQSCQPAACRWHGGRYTGKLRVTSLAPAAAFSTIYLYFLEILFTFLFAERHQCILHYKSFAGCTSFRCIITIQSPSAFYSTIIYFG